MRTLGISLFIVLFSGTFILNAQKGIEDGSKYGKGQDSIDCVKNLSLYRSYYNQKAYKDALVFWRKAFFSCPASSKNLYIHGAKMFDDYISNTKDEALKEKYIDTLLLIYDQRIKYYGGKDMCTVLGYKGADLVKYRSGNVEAMTEAHKSLKESIRLCKTETSPSTMAAFITAGITMYKGQKLELENLVQDFSMVVELMDQIILANPNDEKLASAKAYIESIISTVQIPCESLDNIYGPKIEKDPENADLLATTVGILKSNKCEESKVYYKASTSLFDKQPSEALAYNTARLSLRNEDFEKSAFYYEKAIELSQNNTNKANYYLQLADVTYQKLGNPLKARGFAKQAIELDETVKGKAYMKLGYICASIKGCGERALHNKSVYWLAVDYFAKARSVDESLTEEANQNISSYSRYFPNKEEIFFEGLESGQSFTVPCVGEATVIR